MEIASLKFGYKSRDSLTEFAGYDHNKRISSSYFYDMKNMSGRYKPCLAPRERRALISTPLNIMATCRGMLAKDNLFWISDDGAAAHFYENGREYGIKNLSHTPVLSGSVAHDQERQLISMGAQVVIFPDKVMYNPLDGTVTKLEQEVSINNEGDIDIQITREDGSTYLRTTGDWTAPVEPRNTFVQNTTPKLGDKGGDLVANAIALNAKTLTLASGAVLALSDKDDVYIDGKRYVVNGAVSVGATEINLVDVTGLAITTSTPVYKYCYPINSGDYWIDSSGEHVSLKTYSAATGMWNSIPTTFVRITHTKLVVDGAPAFKANDAVTITGFGQFAGTEDLKQFNNTMIVSASGIDSNNKGWITVTGLISDVSIGYPTAGLTNPVQFRRLCPKMDFVCESKNRLWGCRYGPNNDGSTVNEIYSCALGDPTNWYRFAGTAADSYQVSLGTDGAFTGIAAYDDQVLFFKERYIHKIFGTKPSNFQSSFATTDGISAGSDRSAVVLNETLYYLSKNGVMAYSGGSPASLNAPFGEQRFKDGVGGYGNGKYYICMTNTETNERALWCFNVDMQCWYKEDNADIDHFATLKGNTLVTGAGELTALNGETYDYADLDVDDIERAVEWYAETGDIGLMQDDEKYYSNFQIRFECFPGSEIHIAFQYDDGEWIEKFAVRNDRRRAYNIPFVTPRCDHIRIKFFGKGKAIVYCISKQYEGGGEITRG